MIPKRLDFTVWTLDVGQGDCNVIFTKEGNVFVIDCGSTSKYNVGEKILIPFLKYYGIGRVDGIIISHPDEDHMPITSQRKLGKDLQHTTMRTAKCSVEIASHNIFCEEIRKSKDQDHAYK